MYSKCIGVSVFCSVAVFGQADNPLIVSAGYSAPAQVSVAPGQIITFFVSGIGRSLSQKVTAVSDSLPKSLAGISATLQQASRQFATPLVEVRPVSTCSIFPQVACGTFTAVTVQVPFDLIEQVPGNFSAPLLAMLTISENGSAGGVVQLNPVVDQIRVINACDLLASTPLAFFPCDPFVAHADGSLVWAGNPARGGEALVVYAYGLGRTTPAVATGEPTPNPGPTLGPYPLDFAFRLNALPSQPRPFPRAPDGSIAVTGPASFFAGMTAGSVGLYQVNFVVPTVPDGLAPCDVRPVGAGAFQVKSNLTVSIGGVTSFDGAGICVDTAGNSAN